MNGRKRNDYYKRESEKSKGNSERSELRPPNTSTLPCLIPPLNTYCPTYLTTFLNTISNIIHTTHNITTNRLDFRLCSSLSTDSLLEALQITPFTSTVGNDSFANDKNSGTWSKDLTFNTVIIVYRLDVVNTL